MRALKKARCMMLYIVTCKTLKTGMVLIVRANQNGMRSDKRRYYVYVFHSPPKPVSEYEASIAVDALNDSSVMNRLLDNIKLLSFPFTFFFGIFLEQDAVSQ